MVESQKYRVIADKKNYEIREYAPCIEARVEIAVDYDSAINQGFDVLAGYIFGNNKKKKHISMTAPVTEQQVEGAEKISMTKPVMTIPVGEKHYIVSFIMPEKYTLESLPEPNNKAITFKPVSAHRAAALRFNGRLNYKKFMGKDKELRVALGIDKILPKSNSISAQYDPPWVPGFLRRNEILIDI